MEYKEKYEQALSVARETYQSQPMYREWLEKMFPELSESEDEKVRKSLIHLVHLYGGEFGLIDANTSVEKAITWLEKQGNKNSQVILPTFTFDDILALQCCMETVKKVQEDKDLYEKLDDLHGRVYDAYHLEKQGEQKPINKVEPKFKVSDWITIKE